MRNGGSSVSCRSVQLDSGHERLRVETESGTCCRADTSVYNTYIRIYVCMHVAVQCTIAGLEAGQQQQQLECVKLCRRAMTGERARARNNFYERNFVGFRYSLHVSSVS